MKHNYLNIVIIAVAILITNSCSKDEGIINEENIPSTAEFTFKTSNYGTILTSFVKNKKIEERTKYIELSVHATKAGTYNISTDTINGFKFSGTGELVAKEEWEYQAVRLWASGTPINSGVYEFEVTFGESTATFKTNVVPLGGEQLESKIIIGGTYDNRYDRGKLTAYEAASGDVAWSSSVTGWISQADVYADTIFSNNSEYLEARSINTGELFWSVINTVSSGYNSRYYGITYYKGALYCSTNHGSVLAFKSSDGSLVREFDLETTSIISSIPVIVDDVMYIGHTYLWAFNIDGSLKWKYTLPGFSRSGATVDNGTVYISTDNNELCAVNVSDGSLKWQYTVGTNGEECPTVANGKVYSGNKSLYCLDASTGQLIWQKDGIDFGWNSPNVFNNTVYVSGNGILYSLNAETGETIWKKQFPSPTNKEIAVCKEFVVYSVAGLFVRYAENGESIWSNFSYQSFDETTLNQFIYDKITQEVYLPSTYGNKK